MVFSGVLVRLAVAALLQSVFCMVSWRLQLILLDLLLQEIIENVLFSVKGLFKDKK